MTFPSNPEAWALIAIAFSLAVASISVPLALKRSRSEVSKFGRPKHHPLVIGLLNLIPGLGFIRMGYAIREIPLITLAYYAGIAIALVLPNLSSDTRGKLVFFACLFSGLLGERVANQAWKGISE